MLFLKLIFWLSLFILFYSYLGYGILLWLYIKITSFFQKTKNSSEESNKFEPNVTLVVATYNEEIIIREKIENTFKINYPSEKLEIFFVADGSNDNTVSIIKEFPQINLYFKPERSGKSAAINRIMPFVNSPITIFSDANTFLNTQSIFEIVKHYSNPEIGAVAGEKKVVDLSQTLNTVGAGEGLYWKYESELKKLDAQFYSVVGAAGELFSIRTDLFEPVEKDILLDDFIISMRICKKGYRVMYEPNAFATESPSFSIKDEQKRKIRIAAGGFQSIFLLKDLLNMFKYGKLSFQYISHRVLRWIVCPVLLPVIFLCNVSIWLFTDSVFYGVLLILQSLFYIAASLGWLLTVRNLKVKLLYVPYYFLFMNIAMYIGFFRFINKQQSVLWEKANRKL
jgi:cellulose synthase/poly-beta-1,6-N-acetylglucosamine synthase-like glycosyltransferase